MFSLSLLRLDIDFAALHNASIPQREASRPLRESEASSIVTENHLQTHKSNSCCGFFLEGTCFGGFCLPARADLIYKRRPEEISQLFFTNCFSL